MTKQQNSTQSPMQGSPNRGAMKPGMGHGPGNGPGNENRGQESTPGMPGPGNRGAARIEKARDMRGTIKRLLGYLRPYRKSMIAVLLLVVFSNVLGLLIPLLTGRAIDVLVKQGDWNQLLTIIIIIVAINLFSWLAQLGQNLIVARFSQHAMRDFRHDLFVHIQKLSLSFYDKYPHGDLMSRLTNDMQAISNVLSQNVTALFASVLTLAGVIIMMFVVNGWLALASMIILPAMMWLVQFVGKRTRQGFRQYQMNLGMLNGKLEEMFSGQRVITAFGRESATLDDFSAANIATRDIGIKAQIYSMLIPPLMGIMSNANVAVIAGVGGWMILQGTATVGTISAFYSYSRQFAGPLRQLGNLYNQIQSAIAGAERIFDILDEEPELMDVAGAVALGAIRGDVAFDDVDFSYVEGVPVIKQMNFEAQPGEIIALVGPTGAGKTTMINLLSRFYDIDAGSISIDGQDIRNIQKHSLRRKLGVVLQDTFLFTGSVMDNIRYGRLDATDEEVVEAAKLANAHQYIVRLPHGYHTVLSERGSNLSQGQRQLLAIARAILSNPAILILDEATSSVDTRTEVQIQAGLLKLMEGRTSFVIAHRLSTIRDADQVLVINNGEIVERGTHDDLLTLQGFYYTMYISQFKGKNAPAT